MRKQEQEGKRRKAAEDVLAPAAKKARVVGTELPKAERQGKDGEDDDSLVDPPVSMVPQAGPVELDADEEAAHSQAEDHHEQPEMEEMLEPVLLDLMEQKPLGEVDRDNPGLGHHIASENGSNVHENMKGNYSPTSSSSVNIDGRTDQTDAAELPKVGQPQQLELPEV